MIKTIYIGVDITLSNGVFLKHLDICNFYLEEDEYTIWIPSQTKYNVILDRTGENLGYFYYDNFDGKWFKLLAEWREEQINKILEDD